MPRSGVDLDTRHLRHDDTEGQRVSRRVGYIQRNSSMPGEPRFAMLDK